jgi:PPE-repeat protein
MDFAAVPPEINSGRMYSGPGCAPLLTAAAAWDGLAAELHSTAQAYSSQVASLTGGPWLGRAATSMAAAVSAHVQWLAGSAVRAQDTATAARAAAAAYEAAFLSTVAPAMISANRSQLVALIATNVLGQNGAAIAATEAQYAEMWAQDAAAMYAYAGASADATKLAPFTTPAPVTNSGGLAGQATAVAHTGMSGANGATTALSEMVSAISTALQNLASPLSSSSAAISPAGIAGVLADLGLTSPVTFLTPVNSAVSASSLAESLAVGLSPQANMGLLGAVQRLGDNEIQILQRLDQLGSSATTAPVGPGAAIVGAGSGRAAMIGGLSVPHSWLARAPEMRLVALTSPDAGTAAEAPADTPAGLLSAMGLAAAAMPRRSVATTAGLNGGQPIVATILPTGAAVDHGVPGGPFTGIASELYQFAGLRELGILTDEEFNRHKTRLLGD